MGGWTPVTEDTLKQQPSGWAPVENPPEKGFLGKIWDAVNTPSADFILPKGVKTHDIVRAVAFQKMFGGVYIPGINDFETKASEHLGENPTKHAIRTFLAGSAKDVSDLAASQTSPLGIATLVAGAATKIPGAAGAVAKAGAATKIPGAAGAVAKALTGAASAGFATKGALDLAGETGKELTPESMQKRLLATAQIAGGVAGTASTAKDLIVAPKTAAGLYTSALKPSTTLKPEVRAARIQTGLSEEIPVSAGGADKLNTLLDDLRTKVSATIASKPGATINKYSVASRLRQTAKTFASQVTPESDLAAIGETGNEFLRNQPTNIPAAEAQALKTGTYKQLKARSYGELKGATIEAQKALARGIKEELETQFPEIHGLNAREADLIGLDKSLERAVNRVGNWEEIGIKTPITAGAAAAVTGSTAVGSAAAVMAAVLRNPVLKSKLAIALARKGVPLNAANARIAAYGNAVANAASRAGQTSEQEGSE